MIAQTGILEICFPWLETFFLSLLFYLELGEEEDAFGFTNFCHKILYTVEVGVEMMITFNIASVDFLFYSL